MATRIRMQRFGRKNYPFYQIVVANSRAPRDGKFIERLGSYNPNTNPATIDLNFDRALHWLQLGAQPTDTARTILSREGVCLKKHLLEGVKKGAFDEAAAETKFNTWLQAKKASLEKIKANDIEKQKSIAKTLLEAEKEVNKIKAEALAKKKAELAAAAEAKAKEEAEAAAAALEAEKSAAKEPLDAPETPADSEPTTDDTPAEETQASAPEAETEEPKAE